jgi:hypothetical protein
LLAVVAGLFFVLLLLNTSPVQNYIAKKITTSISKQLGAQISIRKVSISPFNKLNIEGVLVRDQNKDTLLFANLCKIRITDWFFLQKNATLSYVGIEDAVVKINRKTKNWNYEFITNYFKSSDTSNTASNTHYDCKKINLETGFVQLGTVSLDQPSFVMKVIPALQPINSKKTPPSTASNSSPPNINVDEIAINKGTLIIDSDFEKPYPNFDGTHLNFYSINATIKNAFVSEKEIKASLKLSAKERSGLLVKKLNTNFTFNQQIMEFANLDLQTNRSRIGNYYAMKFTDFEKDFSNYLSNVVMVANIKEAEIHTDDIAFFAPAMSIFKTKAQVSGKYTGTVADFTVSKLQLRTGNNSLLTCNFYINVLP